MSIISKDSLGDRMKRYESACKTILPPRLPIILRCDGKAFHTITKSLKIPYDERFIDSMNIAAIKLCKEIQGAQLAYVQSDEISVLIHGYKRFNSQSWFDNEIQKMVSISAAIAAVTFTQHSFEYLHKPAYFDSRVFVVPEADVCNYFLWREQDASRNSIQMLARSLYSHKECYEKNSVELQEMCFLKGKNWNNEPTFFKRGRCIIVKETTEQQRTQWIVDNEIPIFRKIEIM